MAALWTLISEKIATYLVAYFGSGYTWLIQLALKYGGQALGDLIKVWHDKIVRAGVQAQAKIVYDKVQADPTKTAEERAKAYAEYMNAGN